MHTNPLFDTQEYDIEFTDGTMEKYTANVIAENMFAQVDSKANMYSIMKEISDHRMTDTALKHGVMIQTYSSDTTRETPRKTTAGWELLVEWKDGGSSSWEKLKDLKASNPIEVAEYAVANRLVDEPIFKWWVSYMLQKRNRVISKVKSKYGGPHTSSALGYRITDQRRDEDELLAQGS